MVYGDKSILNSEYTIDKTNKTLDIYFKNGGTFSANELEELDFQKLLDDDFVLNKNK